ncbi:MAG: hypothetical protein BIFFINMI_00431 [Phycisphaerae bacterium]|nr:hypothetical protein [Phycisphaerae bacterium]
MAPHDPDAALLTPEQGRALLRLARLTVEADVRSRPLPPPLEGPPFDRALGLFVTLRVDGDLRGCMGTFAAREPLGRLVQEIALTSLADPRFEFRRIDPAELTRLRIEISLLSPMWPTRDPLREMVPGRHGVYVRKGGRSGCFLPQVATEQGWTAAQTLAHCCSGKAGLPPDAWRDPGAEVFLFTAEIHEEAEG